MNANDINRITAAQVVGDHTVELTFSDGFVGRVCLAPRLSGPVFGPLADPSYFCQLQLADDTIRWPIDADFCPDVLRYWCELSNVVSQEETDAYFMQSIAERAAS
jgi:hypothetical protein